MHSIRNLSKNLKQVGTLYGKVLAKQFSVVDLDNYVIPSHSKIKLISKKRIVEIKSNRDLINDGEDPENVSL